MPISKGEMLFDEATHSYTKDGEAYISVTQLLKKHGLSPDYEKVNTDTLKKAAEKGGFIHREIERYIKEGECGFSSELTDFIEICDSRSLTPHLSEFVVYNDEYKVAGTVDLSGLTALNKGFIADVKTTSKLHTESLVWQLSVYAFLGEMTVSEAYGFHLRPDGRSKLVSVKLHSREKVIALLEAERRGEIYQPPRQQVVIAHEEKMVKLQTAIEFHQAQAKQAEAELEKLKDFLTKTMSANGVKKWESENLVITYVAPITRKTIDGGRLKKELPEVAREYIKTSEVKETVRIKLRNGYENAG